MVRLLRDAGLDGLEVYYGDYTAGQMEQLAYLARQHSLVATGGSDFHGQEVLPQYRLGGTPVPSSVVVALRQAHARQREATRG